MSYIYAKLRDIFRVFLLSQGCDQMLAREGSLDGAWVLGVVSPTSIHGPDFLGYVLVLIEKGYWIDGSGLIGNDVNPWRSQFSEWILEQHPEIKEPVEHYRSRANLVPAPVL